MKSGKVYVINLKVPICFHHVNNPLIKQIISGNVEDHLPLGLKTEICFVYWWQIGSVEIWQDGNLIQEIKELESPYGNELPCDL